MKFYILIEKDHLVVLHDATSHMQNVGGDGQ